MANAILDGAGKLLGLPAAGAVLAALAGQVYLWSFGPYGWTQEAPVCPQIETCVVVAGLDGDVSYGFGAGGNVFGVDLDDDVTERLVSRLGAAAGRDSGGVSILKYTREVELPEAGDAREQDRFFGSLARAREIGVESQARMVVIGRVVGDDVIIWFVDPKGEEAPQHADYSMTAPDAQQNLARSYTEALAQVAQAEQRRAQAAATAEAARQAQARDQARVQGPAATAGPPASAPQTYAPAPQNYAANTAPTTSSVPGRSGPPATTQQAPATQPPRAQQAQPARPEPVSIVPPTTTASGPTTAPAAAAPNGAIVYECRDQRVLRVVFDGERRTAVVNQYGRAPTTLRLQSADSTFRYARSGYELTGTAAEVRWRIGSGDPLVCTRRSW